MRFDLRTSLASFFISVPRAPDRCDLPSRSEPIVPAEIETQNPLWVSPEAASSLGRRRSSSAFAQSMATRLWSPRCPVYTLSGPNRLRCSLCNRSQRCPLAMQRSFAPALTRFDGSDRRTWMGIIPRAKRDGMAQRRFKRQPMNFNSRDYSRRLDHPASR